MSCNVLLHGIEFNFYKYIFSATCGTGNISENEGAVNTADDENYNIDNPMDFDADFVHNELLAIDDTNDDFQPNSRAPSRPGSSLNQSCDSDVSSYGIF